MHIGRCKASSRGIALVCCVFFCSQTRFVECLVLDLQFRVAIHPAQSIWKGEMGCFSKTRSRTDPDDEKLQKEQNKKIEQQLQRDKQLYRATHRLLFVGELRGTKRNIVIVGRIALLRLPDSSVLKATLQNQKSL